MNPVYDVALKLLQDGHSVFPVNPVDKRPFIAFQWKQYQTTPPTYDDVARWEKDYPDAMLAQVCGFNGDVFFDFDVKDVDPETPEGQIRMEVLEALDNHEALKDCARVKTPSGGRHFYLRENVPTPKIINLLDQFGNPCGEIRPDVGHYTVIPPSIMSNGDKYEYMGEERRNKLVPNVGDFLKPILEKLGVTYAGIIEGSNYKEPINRNKKSVIADGQRDDTIFRIACSYRRDGMDEDSIYERLKFHNERCVAKDGVTPYPLPDYVLKTKARDAAMKYPIGDNGIIKPIEPVKIEKKIFEQIDASQLLEHMVNEPPIEMLSFLTCNKIFVRGLSHMLSAPPKVGKTSILSQACFDWLKEGKKILYLTEEPKIVWAERLRKKEVPTSGLLLSFVLGMEQKEMLELIDKSNDDIVIIDTLRILGFEDENSNSELNRTLMPFIVKSREKKQTLIFIQHHRKSGGEAGQASTGGHAQVGIVDTVIDVFRTDKDDVNDKKRRLSVLGRIVPAANYIFEMQADGRITFEGNSNFVTMNQLYDVSLEKLKENYIKNPTKEYSTNDIAEMVKVRSKDNLTLALNKLYSDGLLERNPERYTPGTPYFWKYHDPNNFTKNDEPADLKFVQATLGGELIG